MSRGYNRVVLMGNLARDPDVRHTPNKQKVARITVAVPDAIKEIDRILSLRASVLRHMVVAMDEE